MDIGKRIKQLRMQKNLTQEELVSRCELTKGFLSQIENGLSVPSLPTLMDIVEALGTNMSDFFKEEQKDKIVFTKEDFFVDEKDTHIITYIVPNAQKNQMEPIIFELKPGCKSYIIAPQLGEEFGYVLSGTITLVDGNSSYNISEGCTFYHKCDHEHYLVNKTKSNAKILWVSNPPLF